MCAVHADVGLVNTFLHLQIKVLKSYLRPRANTEEFVFASRI